MPEKTILITEPAHSILHRLAEQFLEKPELRVVSFGEDTQLREITVQDRELQFSNCDQAPVDTIWHAWNPAHSAEESRAVMHRVLSFAKRQKAPVIHYVSTTYFAYEGLNNGNGRGRSPIEECQLWNERVLEQSDFQFHIYRVPLFLEEGPGVFSEWTRFIHTLCRFREEIEGRIPGYFAANPLRVHPPVAGTVSLACVDDIVQALQEISSGNLAIRHHQITVDKSTPLADYLPAITELTGLRLQLISDEKQSNAIDKLFALKVKELLAYVNQTAGYVRPGTDSHQSIQVRQASLQEVASAGHSHQLSCSRPTPDWRAGFEKKKIALPDGETLNYYVGGQGEKTLVLINAYGQSFGYWEKFIQALSRRVRMILWLPRGNAPETTGQRLATRQQTHADDLERVLAREGVASCTLAAWCAGPKLALEYYSRYSQRVASMVFIASSFKGLPQHKALETEYEKNLEPLLETIEKFPENADVVLEYLKGILLAQSKQTRSMEQLAALSEKELQDALTAVNVNLQELVLEPFCAANVVAYAQQMRYFWRHNFLPGLEAIHVPVVFVGGDCDRIASQAIAKTVAATIPGAQYLEIKGGTHYIHYEQWELLARIVEDVVNSGGKLRVEPWVSVIEASATAGTLR